MGTSKGYIAPTTSHWSTAKRAVTAFINNRDYDSKAKAASKYATAMKKDRNFFILYSFTSFQDNTCSAMEIIEDAASIIIDDIFSFDGLVSVSWLD